MIETRSIGDASQGRETRWRMLAGGHTGGGALAWYQPEAVVVELVVGGHGDEAPPGTAQRVEDLRGCISPHLDRQADRQARRQIGRQTDTQAGRQTDTQRQIHQHTGRQASLS